MLDHKPKFDPRWMRYEESFPFERELLATGGVRPALELESRFLAKRRQLYLFVRHFDVFRKLIAFNHVMIILIIMTQ